MANVKCNALVNEDYEYHLEGDAQEFCKCVITDKGCVARRISDPENQSSRFFAKGKCSIEPSLYPECPAYGATKDMIKKLMTIRLDEKLK